MSWQYGNKRQIDGIDWQHDSGIGTRFKRVNHPLESLKTNERCFIRKQHKCGKIFGASKSCFIACPTDKNLKPILELMSEKLARFNIEPIIAVEERAYGQDIFCTKICGKIIESQFCIVLLDDFIKEEENIPNSNVYYEYGLMTALRKHIIPLQNEAQELAFNIQSYDTIKYEPSTIGTELDRAIRDAIKITESTEIKEKSSIPEKTILRRLELNGFNLLEDSYYVSEGFLDEAINDTGFKGFVHDENGFCLYLAKIDTEEEFEEYLEDLNVALYRTENIINSSKIDLNFLEKRDTLLQKKMDNGNFIDGEEYNTIERKLNNIFHEINTIEINLDLTSKIVIGVIINPNVDITQFKEKINDIINEYSRYNLVFNNGYEIEIEGEIIPLTPNFNRRI